MVKTLEILVIDDDKIDSMTLNRSIAKSGIKAKVDSALSAKDGRLQIQAKAYDIIFLDYMMPDSNGINFLKDLREEGIDTPVIFITSQGDEKIASQAILEGASDYIPKTLLTPDGVSQSIRNARKLHESLNSKRETELAFKINAERLKESQKLAKIGSWELNLLTDEVYFSDEFLSIIEFEGTNCHFSVFKSCIDKGHIGRFEEQLDLVKKTKKEVQFTHDITGLKQTQKVLKEYLKCVFNNEGVAEKIVGTIQDISEQKRIEDELIQAKDLAIQSVQVKKQFLANMSHEIRTPMNGIIGFSKILEETPLNEEQKQCVESIRMAGDNLMVIINDILDFSKIEANKMTFESISFSFSKSVQSALDLLLPKAKEKKLKLFADIDEGIDDQLIGDPTRLAQILINLIGNSLKFTDKGYVELTVSVQEDKDDQYLLKFMVVDTGIGISEDKLQSIFESFNQASNEMTRKYGGTGLGLTITKKLIELQGGSISCKSELGRGSEFTFEMPFKKSKIQSQLERKEIVNGELSPDFLKNKKILLVEDNHLNQLLAKKVFRKWDYEIEIAENGRIAIDLLEKIDYDLILMDIQMPEMDGNEATKYIRKNMGEKSTIPIIALTAHATIGEEQRCLNIGMNDYLSKPFDAKVLLEKIYLNLHEVEQVISDKVLLNLKYLLELSEGDNMFIKEMMQLYMNNIPLAINQIKSSIKASDIYNIKTEVHKLKSSFGLFGVETGTELVEKIEHSIVKNIPLKSWNDLVLQLIELCKQTLLELEVEMIKFVETT
jgi:signal transduction histidine kinase/DNA-binding response OmpR family regulator